VDTQCARQPVDERAKTDPLHAAADNKSPRRTDASGVAGC
jgi:hypothetical protein